MTNTPETPSRPEVGVVMPVYDAEGFVGEALDSVLRQNYASIRVVAVDDGSTDGSVEALVGHACPVDVLSQENRGPAAARNKALRSLASEFVAFLDADDLWPEGKLQAQVRYLLEHPEVDVVLGRVRYTGELSARERGIRFENADQETMNVNLGAGVFRRRAFETVGLFDETLIHFEDYDWFMRARECALPMVILDRVTLIYRRHPGSLSHRAPPDNIALARVFKRSLDRRRATHAGQAPELPTFFEHDERRDG
jgi:glycosyltransferase involved in cell wall biosynthesis